MFLVFLISLAAGCGDGGGSSSDFPYDYEPKDEPVAMEADLQADDSLALTTQRNVALFLADPDNQSVSRNWYSDAEAKTRDAMKRVPVDIRNAGTYDVCNQHPPRKEQRLQTLLFDASGNELLSVTDEGCKSIDLPAGRVELRVGTVSDDLQDSHEWPAFLTMEGNRVRALFNGCPSCDLEGLDLRNRTLKGTDLNHANLEGRLTQNTKLIHVIAHGSNILTGRPFEEIGQDDYNRGLRSNASADPSAGEATMSRGFWGHVTHAVTHPVDTAKKVVHKGEDVVHKVVEYVDSAELTALITVLSPVLEEGLPDHDTVLSHRYAKSIRARKRPVPGGALPKVIGASEVDHTYVELDAYDNEYHDDVETLAFGAFGENTGGSALGGTETSCPENRDHSCIDTETVAFMMEKEPCKWPVNTGYARVGVCWNLANRGLYYTGKTVNEVPYYVVIETAFGTYGAMGAAGGGTYSDLTAPYRMSQCLSAQQSQAPWDGYDFGVPFTGNPLDLRKVASSAEPPHDVDPRIHLYQEYYADGTGVARRAHDGDGDLPYLQALLRLNVEEKLGQVDPETMEALLAIHAAYLPELTALRDAADFSFADLNALMNAQLAEYRAVLGEERYLKLMGLETSEPFDLQRHAPRY